MMLYLRSGDVLHLHGVVGKAQLHRVPPDVKHVGECLCGLAVSTGHAVFSTDIHHDPLCTLEECRRAGLRSCAALPLARGDEILGVLGVASAVLRDFHEQNTFLEAVAATITVGLQNALLHQDARRYAAQLEQEITERRRVEIDNLRMTREVAEIEMLRRLDKLRSELIANVSHEIRTPLGLIELLCTSLLMSDVTLDLTVQREFLQGIKDETERLKGIVDNLLNLSRMESGCLRLDKQPVDLSQLSADLLQSLQSQAVQHRVNTALTPASPPQPILESGSLRLDFAQQRVWVCGQELSLTPTEYRLLAELVRHAGQVLGPVHLLRTVWGNGSEHETPLLQQAIHRLRRKIEHPDNPSRIVTRRGSGYVYLM